MGFLLDTQARVIRFNYIINDSDPFDPEDVSRGYQKVNVDIRAKTPADEATIGKLISFSPVYEMVSRAIPVEIKMTIQ